MSKKYKTQTNLLIGAVLFVMVCRVGAEEPALGSPNFRPTPAQPIGWRGDGTGRYPGAEPTLEWGRESALIKELCGQAGKPKAGAGETGKPIADGVIREWLVAGPVAMPEGKAAKDDFGNNDGAFDPDEGEKLGDVVWKRVTTDSSWLNLWPLYEKSGADIKKVVAYARTSIYSPAGKPLFLNFMLSGTGRVWLNGKETNAGAFSECGNRTLLKLEKGWNRLLIRVSPRLDLGWSKGTVQWHLNAALFATEKDEYAPKNIAWSTPLTDDGPGIGSPIVVGDKLFMQCESNELVCINKKDGKPLWAKSNTFAAAATEQERKDHADACKEADDLAAKFDTLMQTYCDAPDKFGDAQKKAKSDLLTKINTLMKGVDAKYKPQPCEAGESAQTPISDGENVYAVFGSSVAVCYGLDGKRKWATFIEARNSEHGYCSSPCLMDGKLIFKSGLNYGALALDCKTGAQVWKIPVFKGGTLNMSATPVRLSSGEKLLALSYGTVLRASDGVVLVQDLRPPYPNVADMPSSGVEGNRICSYYYNAKDANKIAFAFQTLPATVGQPLTMQDVKICTFDLKAFPTFFSYDICSSPLLYQGLAYVVSVDGVLTVMDAPTGTVVYQKLLDLSPVMNHGGPMSGALRGGCSSSPTLGGKHIFIWDDQGSTVVFEPGREYKQLHRNRVERSHMMWGQDMRQEGTSSCPVFEGNAMYYRSEACVYCVGGGGK